MAHPSGSNRSILHTDECYRFRKVSGKPLADHGNRACPYRIVNELMAILSGSSDGDKTTSRINFPRIDLQPADRR